MPLIPLMPTVLVKMEGMPGMTIQQSPVTAEQFRAFSDGYAPFPYEMHISLKAVGSSLKPTLQARVREALEGTLVARGMASQATAGRWVDGILYPRTIRENPGDVPDAECQRFLGDRAMLSWGEAGLLFGSIGVHLDPNDEEKDPWNCALLGSGLKLIAGPIFPDGRRPPKSPTGWEDGIWCRLRRVVPDWGKVLGWLANPPPHLSKEDLQRVKAIHVVSWDEANACAQAMGGRLPSWKEWIVAAKDLRDGFGDPYTQEGRHAQSHAK